jgi:hypothetical protein
MEHFLKLLMAVMLIAAVLWRHVSHRTVYFHPT